jgi:hypothetical protein
MKESSQHMSRRLQPLIFLLIALSPLSAQKNSGLDFLNHNRPILDAHNCYPYEGQWTNRIQRALASGFPVSIEQDLAWYVDPATGRGRVVVSHTKDTTGSEPLLRDYFFETVRPVVEKALRENKPETWPLIVLHFDVKDNSPELLRATWQILGEFEPWLSTAVKASNPKQPSPIDRKPILAITEDPDIQEQIFFNEVPEGGRLRIFGSAHGPKLPSDSAARNHLIATLSPEALLPAPPTNYRRWANNSWFAVEEGGQTKAGDWITDDDKRLRALVDHAHKSGYWIRFYTLDGFTPETDQGWDKGYNFGTREAAEKRWNAAIAAGVNFIATDQYEDLAATLRKTK